MDWKVGVEVELIAPRGASRRDLAVRMGSVRRIFHPQSETSLVPGTPVFENLTLGFEAFDREGRLAGRFVDDLTLQDDCDKRAPAKPGWYRIVSDDARWLRLLALHADAERDLPDVLEPFAALFGVAPEPSDGMWRVADAAGAPIAVGAPLPGERERPCEIVSPPLQDRHGERLEALLGPARELGFAAPAEGAVHLHFDATRLASARFVQGLVRAQLERGAEWRARFRTNPRCRRLGPPPEPLVALVEQPGFADRPWERARAELAALGLEKWVDVNLVNLIRGTPSKYTVEVRILPVSLHAEPIVEAMAFFAELFGRLAQARA
jgi:hypothetical protein